MENSLINPSLGCHTLQILHNDLDNNTPLISIILFFAEAWMGERFFLPTESFFDPSIELYLTNWHISWIIFTGSSSHSGTRHRAYGKGQRQKYLRSMGNYSNFSSKRIWVGGCMELRRLSIVPIPYGFYTWVTMFSGRPKKRAILTIKFLSRMYWLTLSTRAPNVNVGGREMFYVKPYILRPSVAYKIFVLELIAPHVNFELRVRSTFEKIHHFLTSKAEMWINKLGNHNIRPDAKWNVTNSFQLAQYNREMR